MRQFTGRMKGTTDDTSAPGYIYANTSVTDTFDSDAFNEHFGLLSNEQLVIVRPHTGDDDAAMLEELKPKYIVMYDADPAFVRRVEVRPPFPSLFRHSCSLM